MNISLAEVKMLLPSVGIERKDVGLDTNITVNGFEVEKLSGASWFGELKTNLQNYFIIHPYYLKKGMNEVKAEYWVDDGREVDMGDYQLIFTLTEIDYNDLKYEKNLFRFESELLKRQENNKKVLKSTSTILNYNQEIKEWSWIKDPKIEDSEETKKSLYKEYVKIWSHLKSLGDKKNQPSEKTKNEFKKSIEAGTREFVLASEMKGKKYTHISNMFEIASTLKERNIPVGLRDLIKEDELSLKIFANGKRARLVRQKGTLFEVDLSIDFVGGAHDADPGPAGEDFCFWFKKGNRGEWIVDAVTPIGVLLF